MSESVHTNPSLYSKGMVAVICAQFLSAFGDNALLFATLALMKQLYYPEWSQPVLQMLFVGAYILFAPFVGQFADSFAKGRVMMVANGLKLLGAGCICFGVNPFIGYTLVGIGAAAYSPAKYGILGELTTGDKLVKANGLMESSTIAAILLGSMAGGILADWHVLAALIVCALVYGGAVVANLWIPRLPAARPGQSWRFKPMTHSFFSACRTLWRNGETRFSLMGTSLFWGAGVTLRFLLVIWVPVALGITSNAMPTYLNAMVAVGDCAGCRGGGEAGDPGDGVALYAGRDFDRYRGDSLCGAAVAAAGVRSAAAARGVRRVLYRTAERAAAGAWETFGRGR
ncbi:Lysophospholipid transporter LplT [Klebsiella pneumoniae]|nr:Lysophospholipid transporter LplT [Klebsiella pneumoniae]